MLAGLAATVAFACAADIHGMIIIERKLTRYNVSAAAGIYQRGGAVPLGDNPEDDPISFERAHVAVYLEGTQGHSGPAKEEVMEQKNRRFVPDLLVIPAGSTVSFPNSDPIFHNVFSLSKAKSFDLGNYPLGKTREVTFLKPGVVAVYCHLHPNMAASIVVTPSRWGTRAAPDGAFSLRDIPPGTYSVVAWHKAAGTFRKQITLSDRDNLEVDFVLPYDEPPSPNSLAHR